MASENLSTENKMDVCEDEPAATDNLPLDANTDDKKDDLIKDDNSSGEKNAANVDSKVVADGKPVNDDEIFSNYINSLAKMTQDVMPNKLDGDEDEMAEKVIPDSENKKEKKENTAEKDDNSTKSPEVSISDNIDSPKPSISTVTEEKMIDVEDDVYVISEESPIAAKVDEQSKPAEETSADVIDISEDESLVDRKEEPKNDTVTGEPPTPEEVFEILDDSPVKAPARPEAASDLPKASFALIISTEYELISEDDDSQLSEKQDDKQCSPSEHQIEPTLDVDNAQILETKEDDAKVAAPQPLLVETEDITILSDDDTKPEDVTKDSSKTTIDLETPHSLPKSIEKGEEEKPTSPSNELEQKNNTEVDIEQQTLDELEKMTRASPILATDESSQIEGGEQKTETEQTEQKHEEKELTQSTSNKNSSDECNETAETVLTGEEKPTTSDTDADMTANTELKNEEKPTASDTNIDVTIETDMKDEEKPTISDTDVDMTADTELKNKEEPTISDTDLDMTDISDKKKGDSTSQNTNDPNDSEVEQKLVSKKETENLLLKEVFTKITDLETDGVIISSNSQITITKKIVVKDEPKSEAKLVEDIKAEKSTTTKLMCEEAMSPATAEKKGAVVKDCLNYECNYKGSDFFEAPDFILSHYKVNKKQKNIYVCDECFHLAIAKYEELCGALEDIQPLYLQEIPRRPDLVEILDSSDEEDDDIVQSDQSIMNKIPLDEDTLALIDKELENIVIESFSRVNIDQQMKWNREILAMKLDKQHKRSQELKKELNAIQRKADNISNKLYKTTNYFFEQLPSWDSVTGRQPVGPDYPPSDKLEYPELNTTSLYYAVRTKLLNSWVPCRIIKKKKPVHNVAETYDVKFLRTHKNLGIKTISRNFIAYGKPPEVRLNLGVRVIALFNDVNKKAPAQDNAQPRLSFFPGIIAEPLQEYNNWRYLVFFDDGYAQYVIQENIRVVCGFSKNVWEDVYQGSSEFIKSYLKQFSGRRPMVQIRKGQHMTTEWNGKWLTARAHNVDGSLVQMFFEDSKRLEWIYRGSTRFLPLFRQQKTQATPKRNEPSIEYVSVDKNNERAILSNAPSPQNTTPQILPAPQAAKETPPHEKRAVAKKSSAHPPPRIAPIPTVQHLNNSTIYVDEDNKPKGKVVYYTAKKHMPPKRFVDHICGPSCLYEVTHNLRSYSPLSKPLLSGWERQICKSKAKKCVVYRAPCGRRLRNMSELHRYLRLTDCPLNVENFDYDFLVHCLAEYVIDTCIVQKSDISDGIEQMVVPCVNYYDNTMPPPCTYSAKRIPTEDVHLNLKSEFLCGCDCEDDCLDKKKCQCWQLTIAGAKFGNPNTPPEEVGYEFKRLPEPVPTGIYECNANCKCKASCLNRVAQQQLQMKLQVFKTVNRGWGLRCLNDVPKGSFICCYAGHLLTEQHANEAGENLGDEYFAELDYIEVVENLKEGYEPDVVNDDDLTDDDYDPRKEIRHRGGGDDSDDEFISNVQIYNETPIKTRYRTRNSLDSKQKVKAPENRSSDRAAKSLVKPDKNDYNESDEETERQPISFTPSTHSMLPTDRDMEQTKYKSIRKFYGKNESVYIMDAKKSGNIGRYFNHSCAPNLFVQNVFVDTHDLRFPWVAFFALSHIRAGTELTWNYNYDVGSVPGKVLYCQCGSEACRGRLL